MLLDFYIHTKHIHHLLHNFSSKLFLEDDASINMLDLGQELEIQTINESWILSRHLVALDKHIRAECWNVEKSAASAPRTVSHQMKRHAMLRVILILPQF